MHLHGKCSSCMVNAHLHGKCLHRLAARFSFCIPPQQHSSMAQFSALRSQNTARPGVHHPCVCKAESNAANLSRRGMALAVLATVSVADRSEAATKPAPAVSSSAPPTAGSTVAFSSKESGFSFDYPESFVVAVVRPSRHTDLPDIQQPLPREIPDLCTIT